MTTNSPDLRATLRQIVAQASMIFDRLWEALLTGFAHDAAGIAYALLREV